MIKTMLATLGLGVLAHQLYLHCRRYQRLKIENACLHRYWQEIVAGKP